MSSYNLLIKNVLNMNNLQRLKRHKYSVSRVNWLQLFKSPFFSLSLAILGKFRKMIYGNWKAYIKTMKIKADLILTLR